MPLLIRPLVACSGRIAVNTLTVWVKNKWLNCTTKYTQIINCATDTCLCNRAKLITLL